MARARRHDALRASTSFMNKFLKLVLTNTMAILPGAFRR